jgi:4a-hydroxytetrahydrobiopterin dehydratase
MRELLSAEARTEKLAPLLGNGWTETADGSGLTKTFRFADFSHAFAYMVRVALEAEKLDHHPDWRNVWNRVEVTLTTHSSGGISDLDIRLATEMDRIAGQPLS